MNYKIFKNRRNALVSQLKDSEAIILFSKPQYYRQHDVMFPYRQDSFFYYLTGFEESNSCLIIKKKPPMDILFVQEKDSKKEMWDGFIFGEKEAKKVFLMDECVSIKQFESQLISYLKGISGLYCIQGVHSSYDQRLQQILIKEKTRGLKFSKKCRLLDGKDLISEMRMIKDPEEIKSIRKSCDIAKNAHVAVMKATRVGINEHQLHGVFIHSIMNQLSKRESYPGIFASGLNALTLHYVNNNQTCLNGDLILVDAGAEWNYYASDITRTFPVNGKFSNAQKILYNHVLYVQKEVISMIRPGVSFRKIQNETTRLILECLKQEKILNKNQTHKDVKKFFPHNFGHLLGIDVHDVGVLKNKEKTYRLEPSMVLTVEPGIYIPKDCSTVPEKFRGIGIRIEDNILVTKDGFEILSKDIPKEVTEIEQIMNQS